jgi:lactate dehydrogenase-like 2-hydroxyacid dehydrogenase
MTQPVGNRLVGAEGEMEQRISNNLAKADCRVLYCEKSPHGSELTTGLGRELIDTDEAVAEAAAKAMLFGHV